MKRRIVTSISETMRLIVIKRDKIGPDLPAIAPVVAEQGRWRHAVIVVAKRIDAGFEETEHELVSNGNRGRSRIRKRRRARRQKRRSGRQIEKKDND